MIMSPDSYAPNPNDSTTKSSRAIASFNDKSNDRQVSSIESFKTVDPKQKVNMSHLQRKIMLYRDFANEKDVTKKKKQHVERTEKEK